MIRRKLLAAAAGCLALPAIAAPQDKVYTPADPPAARADKSWPAYYLPDPSDLKNAPHAEETKVAGPGAELIPPQKIELPSDPPTVTIPPAPARTITPGTPVPAFSAPPLATGPAPFIAPTVPQLAAPIAQPGQVWFAPEYLYWRTSRMNVPPLVTSSPFGTPVASTGVLGVPGTATLFGGERGLGEFRSGVRLRAGFWFEPTQTFGLDAGFFYLGQQSRQGTFFSNGQPNALTRPFFDILNGTPSSEFIGFTAVNPDGTPAPDRIGGISARLTTDFWGADINLRRYLFGDDDGFRVDGLIGFRYQRLRDTLDVTSSSMTQTVPTSVLELPLGSVIRVRDAFESTSNFYGGQFGLAGRWSMGGFTLGTTAKVALGVTSEEVRINGSTVITPGGGTALTFPGGLLAQPTNSGRHRADRFSVVPELGVNLGYQITPNLRVFGGYSVIYWSSVARVGDQVDPTVNTSQATRLIAPATLTGPARPAFILRDSAYWAHGANVGVQVSW
jgi:hypothetical protein